jgi:hypothetical protein
MVKIQSIQVPIVIGLAGLVGFTFFRGCPTSGGLAPIPPSPVQVVQTAQPQPPTQVPDPALQARDAQIVALAKEVEALLAAQQRSAASVVQASTQSGPRQPLPVTLDPASGASVQELRAQALAANPKLVPTRDATVGGFAFHLDSLVRSGMRVVGTYTVTNQGADATLYLSVDCNDGSKTLLLTPEGEFRAKTVTLGTSTYTYVSQRLVPGASVKGKATFEGVPATVTQADLVQIGVTEHLPDCEFLSVPIELLEPKAPTASGG